MSNRRGLYLVLVLLLGLVLVACGGGSDGTTSETLIKIRGRAKNQPFHRKNPLMKSRVDRKPKLPAAEVNACGLFLFFCSPHGSKFT